MMLRLVLGDLRRIVIVELNFVIPAMVLWSWWHVVIDVTVFSFDVTLVEKRMYLVLSSRLLRFQAWRW